MSEVKSVKVDNWGVFFLQKLQNFFNKTDYCDLTLQFNDNSQLKVHRLVLSACTDYFNVLEQTCEVVDDILVMPRGLQADVVVPIVNFMYTGTLEFEINMYGRLLRTAKDMNMTVLLKLLEAHKRTVEGTRQSKYPRGIPMKTLNKHVAALTPQKPPIEKTYTSPGTSLLRRTAPIIATSQHHQYKSLQIKPVTPSTSFYQQSLPEPVSILTKYPHSKTVKGPSRFDDDNILPAETFESSFDTISYESKPLITANQICKEETELEDYDVLIPKHDTSTTFEALRRSYTNNKRPSSSVSSFESPPEKKPNIQDVKEYAEQQRMRKQIAAEYDDENEYDDMLDDEFHNDDDDEDYVPPPSFQKQHRQQHTKPQTSLVKQERDQKPTIVVKDSAGSSVNHAKIISEVLKKYPHLVKNNKNIKLKIMAKSNSAVPSQKIIIKQEPGVTSHEIPKPPIMISKNVTMKPVVTQKLPVLPTNPPVATAAPVVVQPPKQVVTTPRRIDSKTMHALIAQGAENTTGPWLCLKCGVNGRPISIPSYRGFRRHLINTHKEKVDPRLCEHCGWRSPNNRRLYFHMKVQHSIKPPYGYDFPICEYCSELLFDEEDLEAHIQSEHPETKSNDQQCLYCNKCFSKEIDLYHHMREKHRERAQDDGVLEFSDEESEFEGEKYLQQHAGEVDGSEKIKILSDIPLPKASVIPTETVTTLEPSSEAEALNNVATGIAASLGLIDSSDGSDAIQYITADLPATGPKFVNADGNLMELTEAQREEIISQLDNQHGEVVMVLNQESFEPSEEITTGGDVPNVVAAATPTDSNMVVMFNESQIKKESEPSASTNLNADDDMDLEPSEPTTTKQPDKEIETVSKKRLRSATKRNSIEKVAEETTEKIADTVEKKVDESNSTNKEDEEADDEEEEEEEAETDTSTPVKDTEDKLKLLTGDWSEDDEEDDEEEQETEKKSSNKSTKDKKDTTISAAIEEDDDDTAAPATEDKDNKKVKKHASPSSTTNTKSEKEKEIEDPAEDDDDEETAIKNEDKSDEIEPDEDSKDTEKKDDEDEETKKNNSDDLDKKATATEDTMKTEESSEKDDRKTETTIVDDKKSEGEVITKDEIRNLISDWGDDEEEEI